MTEEKLEKLIRETGGDVYYGDVFMKAAEQAAASRGVKIEKRHIEYFYKELEKARKKWKERQNQL
jgi:ferredoxin-NADP reductase